MAVDMFLRIDNVTGESGDASHKDEIEVISFSWAATQTGTSASGGGSGAGKVSISDIEIRKRTDRASPVLYQFCCTGQHIAKADLTIRKAGGEQLEYLKIHLEDLIISSFFMGGRFADEQVEEAIRINFTRSAVTYSPQTGDGAGAAVVSGGYDTKANKTFSQ